MSKYLICFLFFTSLTHAQTLVAPNPKWGTTRWDAKWIGPQEEGKRYGIYHFRKEFTLQKTWQHFIIHISGDNRYRLFVNGTYVTEGPQLGDVRHWHYESLDIAPLLHAGDNLLAIQITQYGEAAPVYMMGRRAGLIVQGEGELESVLNTNETWKYIYNESTTPIVFRPGQEEVSHQYYAAGPLDRVEGDRYPWNWEQLSFDDASWRTPKTIQTGAPFESAGYGDEQWELVPRSIPLMEHTYQTLPLLRRKNGKEIPGSKDVLAPITIPANETATLLFDQKELTTAFPELIVSNGKGRAIKITYAEALFADIQKKGNRDSIKGQEIKGVYDVFVPDGGDHRNFTTTSYRAFRYLQLDIAAGDQPLVIEKIGSWFTGYPFQEKASFSSSDPSLSQVFDIGWRTARRCAYDTYMDCPYWERLQYVGDTRIQALVSYYVSGDARLAKNAIEQFEWSITYDGLTYSRYPSALQQFIPNYSLVWVLMINDYLLYQNDPEFVKSMLPAMDRVLNSFEQYITEDSLMTEQPYWDFIDHTFNTHKLVTESYYKRLTTNSLFYAHTLNRAAEVFSYFGENEKALRYSSISHKLKASVQKKCWDANSKMFADTPDKKQFSMHSNILAILCGLMPKDQQVDLLKRITSNPGIIQTTLYFDFYLARAMNQAGSGDQYFALLDHWRSLLKMGLTTFPEGVNRSDCHAWSASPDFEMLATFAGIQPQLPCFRKVVVHPCLQKLDQVKASMPHWAGMIEVDFTKKGDVLKGSILLPPGIPGRLEWGTKVLELQPGVNKIDLNGQR